MAINYINYDIDLFKISPATEQFGGTQGDHRITAVKFVLSDVLFNAISNIDADNKLFYRFDVYNGENSIWQSASEPLVDKEIILELEEKHTRFGGKLRIYLVITTLSYEKETETELYSFPTIVRLNARPDGIYQEGENYESMTSLAESAKKCAIDASNASLKAQKAKADVSKLVSETEEKLNNGEFDGVGVELAQIVDDELIITYTNGAVQNLGNVKGDTGLQGQKGDKGDKGDMPDMSDYYTKGESDNTFAQFDNRLQEAIDYSIRMDYRLDDEYYTKEEVDNIIDEIPSGSGGEVDLSGYMKEPTTANYADCVLGQKTDTEENVWITVDAGNGLAIYNGKHLGVNPATQAQILAKKEGRKPICTEQLDYAIKVGLTTNNEVLTEEEKTKAQSWLGLNSYELVEEITLTETENVDKNTTPSGESYASLFKNMMVSVFNSTDKGCSYIYIYRASDMVTTTMSGNANEFVVCKSEMIAPDLAEWEITKKGSNNYSSNASNGYAETSSNVSRVLVGGCTAGTVIKIYGMRGD